MGRPAVKKIRIHSDGFGNDAVIMDEDGKTLDNVVDATIYMTPREPNRINLEFIATPVNVAGSVDEVTLTCPCCEESFTHNCGGNTLGGSQSNPYAQFDKNFICGGTRQGNLGQHSAYTGHLYVCTLDKNHMSNHLDSVANFTWAQ